METQQAKRNIWGWALLVGAVWGALEIFGGALLKEIAPEITGSVMAALGGFVLVVVYALTRNYLAFFTTVLMASSLRIVNSLTWHLPAVHLGFGNHVFGMVTEAGALVLFLLIFQKNLHRPAIQRLVGISYPFLSALIFPLVRLVTGNSACLFRNSGIPVAWVFAPLAMLLGALLCPAGFRLASYLEVKIVPQLATGRLRWSLSGLTLALLCLSVLIHV